MDMTRMMDYPEPEMPVGKPVPKLLIWFVIICLPFYLNDFSNIYVRDWRAWLCIDYASVKLFPLLLAIWLVRSGRATAADFGLKMPGAEMFIAIALWMGVVGTALDENFLPLFKKIIGTRPLGGIPVIHSGVFNWIDLTLGLLMVGVFEELVFRGFAFAVISRFTNHPLWIIGISSTAFGLIHWSSGLHTVINAAIIGAVFMVAYIKTRSTPPLMVAHFIIDFVAFAGVIPRSWFIFMPLK